jgi:hypothetical protein
MTAANVVYHDLTHTRQGVVSGPHEHSHAICQDVLAVLEHESSFQVRRSDANHYASEGVGFVRTEFGGDQNVFAD